MGPPCQFRLPVAEEPAGPSEIDREAEMAGRGRQPVQVPFEEAVAPFRGPADRLQQRETRPAPGDDPGLEPGFPVLLAGPGVPDDPPAGPVLGGPGLPVGQEGPDGHQEGRPPPGGDQADRPGVDLPGGGLQPGDDPHRRGLRGPGHRAAGEEGRQDPGQGDPGPGGHGRGHLEEGRVGLDGEERTGPDAAGLGDPAQVVAEHIDDHQVLGPVLLRAGQPRFQPGVLLRGSPPPPGSLHRPGDDPVPLEAEEEFRRGGSDPVPAGLEKGPRPLPLSPDHPGEECPGVAPERAGEAVGVIHLVGLAPGDPPLDLFDRPAVPGLADRGGPLRELPPSGFGRGFGRGDPAVEPETEEGKPARRADREGGVEGGGGLVTDEAGGKKSGLFDPFLDLFQGGDHFFPGPGLHRPRRPAQGQPAPGVKQYLFPS